LGKIYEDNGLYSFIRPYFDHCTRSSYKQFTVEGEKNVPQNGAVIFAPNHCNTLMDALVVLQGRKGPTVFGARADIFSKPTIAKILNKLRILPIARGRDGGREVLKNIDTLESIVETLDNDVPFCMFCEGTHRPKHSLLPVKKGIFRVAKAAVESRLERRKKRRGKKIQDSDKVFIVPVGLEYGDYFHYRSSCRMRYGKPIDVTHFFEENAELNEAKQCELLKEKISEGISKCIVYFPDDEQYETRWERFKHLRQLRKVKRLGKRAPVRNFLQIILGLPLFLFSVVAAFPQLIAAALICSKVKDRAFHNTMRFATKAFLGPLVWLIWTILLFCLFPKEPFVIGEGNIPWCIIPVVLSLLIIPTQNIVYDYLNLLRHTFGKS